MSRVRQTEHPPSSVRQTRSRRIDTIGEAVAAQCRAIIMSEEGIARLTKEILEGDSKTFWRAITLGFGRPPKIVELEPKSEPEPAVSLDGLSDNVIAVLAAIALEQNQAEVDKSRDAENEAP